jgi:hypothetical protein
MSQTYLIEADHRQYYRLFYVLKLAMSQITFIKAHETYNELLIKYSN